MIVIRKTCEYICMQQVDLYCVLGLCILHCCVLLVMFEWICPYAFTISRRIGERKGKVQVHFRRARCYVFRTHWLLSSRFFFCLSFQPPFVSNHVSEQFESIILFYFCATCARSVQNMLCLVDLRRFLHVNLPVIRRLILY